MYRFNLTDSDPDRRWFRVGSVDVTTTVALTGLALLSLVSYALSPSLQEWLWFDSALIARGQLWRLFTWPIVTEPSLWELLTVGIYFYFGSIIESAMGRVRYAWFTGVCGLAPAAVVAVVAVTTSTRTLNAGLAVLEIAVILAFILIEPRAQGFFGIPFWIFGAVILGLQVIQLVGTRNWIFLFWILATLGLAALFVRAFGLTEFEQIPLVPLPSMVSGDPYAKANRRRERSAKQRRAPSRRRANRDDVVVPMHRVELTRAEQADMDRLLDKISDSGIESLDGAERNRLDDYSRRLRGS